MTSYRMQHNQYIFIFSSFYKAIKITQHAFVSTLNVTNCVDIRRVKIFKIQSICNAFCAERKVNSQIIREETNKKFCTRGKIKIACSKKVKLLVKVIKTATNKIKRICDICRKNFIRKFVKQKMLIILLIS